MRHPSFKTLFLLCLGLFSSHALAATKYDSGVKSSISRDGDLVVEVHSSAYFNTLWYHVGVIKNGKVKWGKSQQYDDGIKAKVSVKGNTVVEVHESPYFNTLWYRVGTLDRQNKFINWAPSQLFDEGHNPSVALNEDGSIVTAHQQTESILDYCTTDSDGETTCYYRYIHRLFTRSGFVHDSVISWTDASFYTRGKKPSIAVSDNTVVEVHIAENSNDLLYRVGKLQNGYLTWVLTGSYGRGTNPSVAISGNQVSEMHESEFFNRLWYHVGEINLESNFIHWGHSHSYDRGTQPSIALDDKFIIETHTSDVFNSLYHSLGTINQNNKNISWKRYAKSVPITTQ
jgi:hypothetical protein